MPDSVWIVQFLVGLVISGLVYDRRQIIKELAQVKKDVADLDSQHKSMEVRVDAVREILELKIETVDKNVLNVLSAVKELSHERRQSDRAETK